MSVAYGLFRSIFRTIQTFYFVNFFSVRSVRLPLVHRLSSFWLSISVLCFYGFVLCILCVSLVHCHSGARKYSWLQNAAQIHTHTHTLNRMYNLTSQQQKRTRDIALAAIQYSILDNIFCSALHSEIMKEKNGGMQQKPLLCYTIFIHSAMFTIALSLAHLFAHHPFSLWFSVFFLFLCSSYHFGPFVYSMAIWLVSGPHRRFVVRLYTLYSHFQFLSSYIFFVLFIRSSFFFAFSLIAFLRFVWKFAPQCRPIRAHSMLDEKGSD